jgi:hypothetical protein
LFSALLDPNVPYFLPVPCNDFHDLYYALFQFFRLSLLDEPVRSRIPVADACDALQVIDALPVRLNQILKVPDKFRITDW